MLGKPCVKLFSMVLAVMLICGAFTETFAYSGGMLPDAGYAAVKSADLSGTFADSPSVLERYRSMLSMAGAERTEAEQETTEEAAGAEALPQSDRAGQEAVGHAVSPAAPVVQAVGSSSHTADSVGGTNSAGQSVVDENASIVRDESDVGNQDESSADEEIVNEPAGQEAAAGNSDILEVREADSGKLNGQNGSYAYGAYGAALPDRGLDVIASEQEGVNTGSGEENPEDGGEKKEDDGDEEGDDSEESPDENTEDIEGGGENSSGSSDERDSGADDGEASDELIEENDQLDDLEPVQDVQTDEIMLAGNGTASSPFLIENEEQLLYITSLQGGSLQGVVAMEAHYRLMADLDLSEAEGFYGVGSQAYPFRGVFDGNGYTVALNINAPSANYVGLFGYVKDASILNINIEGSITGNNYVGSVAGYVEYTAVAGIENRSTISSKQYTGGITGYALGSSITEVVNRNGVSGSGSVGGIAGYLDNTVVSEAGNSGEVRSSAAYMGGIAGDAAASTITDSVNEGSVTSTMSSSSAYSYTGGIAGRIQSGTLIEGGSSLGSVSGQYYTGGITSHSSASTIRDSEASGAVSGRYYTGGIAGYLTGGAIEDSRVLGPVSGTASTGGIAGYISGSPVITGSSFSGEKISGNAPGMIASNTTSGMVVSDSGFYISGSLLPSDAQILVNDRVHDEELIERGPDGIFSVYVTVGKASGGAISVENVPESISFLKDGYSTEKVYLSLNNAKASFTLHIGEIILEESSTAESIQGEGTEELPFLIENEEQLLYITSLQGSNLKGVPAMEAHYRLLADLDLSGAAGFFGMGSQSAPFQGVFDGSGHEVELNISTSVESYVGLFRYADGAEIRDIHVSGSVKGMNYTGGIAGYLDSSSVKEAEVSASVSGSSYTGGITGYAKNSIITKPVNRNGVSGSGSVGGIAGDAAASTITDSVNEGSVTSTMSSSSAYSYTGGIAGRIQSGTLIEGGSSLGSVSGQYYTGGITSHSSASTIRDSEASGAVSGRYYTGGIAGYLTGGAIEDSRVLGPVSGTASTGGIAGYISGSPVITGSSFSGEKISGNAPGMIASNTTSGMVVSDSGFYISGSLLPSDAQILVNDRVHDEELIERGVGGIFSVYVTVGKASGGAISVENVPESISFLKEGYSTEKVYLSLNNAKASFTLHIGEIILEESSTAESIQGEGTEELPFLIENEEQLLYITSLQGSNLKGVPAMEAHYRLLADLDLSGAAGFFGMGSQSAPFQGVFDGSGHEVELNISTSVESYVGLFRYADGAEIRDIHVSGSVKGMSYTGGIAGYLDSSSVKEAEVSASVSGSSYTGGITGYAKNSIITKPVNRNGVSGSGSVGGIAGYLDNTVVSEAGNSGEVRSSAAYMGGIAGDAAASTITDSVNKGSVTSTMSSSSAYSYTGGIAGRIQSGTLIEGGSSLGSVSGQYYTGGITSHSSASAIRDSEASGAVSGRYYTGGIAGYLTGGAIEDSRVLGPVSGTASTGGIAGYISGSPVITGSSFSGEKISGNAPGMIASNTTSGMVVSDSGFYISGSLLPSDAQILVNDRVHDEELIERGVGGIFSVYVTVGKASGGAISVENVPESISFLKEGYSTEKVYLSLNNAKASFTLHIGEIILEESSAAESIQGEGTEESPFLIENEEQLLYITSLQGSNLRDIPAMEAHYQLIDDLDISQAEMFFGIGSTKDPFSGTFDGNGHTIKLNIESSYESYTGLFRYTDGASVKNISIDGVIAGSSYTGAVAGYASNSAFSSIEVSASVTGGQYTGGIAGYTDNTSIQTVAGTAGVRGSSTYTGGIAGRMVGGEITGGSVSGSVSTSSTSSNKYAGGIAGHAAGTLFHGNIVADTSLSNGVNVLIGDGSSNQFYENGILLSAETSVEEPEIAFTGFEDITAAETIDIIYEGRTFTAFIPVNQSKNNSVTAATMRLSKAAHYDRLFTLKSSGAAYNFVLPAYIALVPKSNVLLDVVSVESPENAVIDTVLKTVSASVANDISSAAVSLETSEGTTWKLYSDAACTMEIADLVLRLEPGQNTAYIEIVGSDGESRQIYTLSVFREHQKPMPVTGLLAITGTYEVQLRWDMAYEASVQGYNLYRSVSPGSGYTKITAVTSRDTLSYVDRTVTADWTYYYKISAYNDLGIESDLSDYVSVTVSSDTVPPVVLGISPIDDTTIGKNTDITVRVEDNTALKEVWLEYQIGEENEWVFVDRKSVTGTSGSAVFRLGEIGHHGAFKVRAFARDQKDNVSDGTPVRLYYMDSQGPEKVTGLAGTSTDSTVTLRWNNVSDSDFSYFTVEQRDEGEDSFRQIARVTTTLGYHVLNLQPDTGYWFRVRAFDRFDNPGEYSDAVLVYTNSDTAAPQVTSILPKPGYYSDSIPVQVTATDNVGVTVIEVEISQNGTAWTTAGSKSFEAPLKSASASFDISTAGIPEGPVFVRAFAEDAAGNRSSASSIVEHRIDRTPPARPQGLLVENTAEYILVQWEKGSETDLKAYSVYRSEAEAGEYKKVASNLSALGYCDTDAQFGKTYYYKVTAIDAAGNESAFSDIISGILSADDTPPWIYSVSPGGGSPVGTGAIIRVQARDNVNLASITAEYLNGSDWMMIGTKNVSGISAGADFIWDNQSLAGGEYQVRFYAEDAAGNTSDYITAVFELKSFTIDKPDVTLTPEDMSIRLSWEPVSYADVQGYRVYRIEEARDVLLAEIDRGQLTSYTDHNLDPDQIYTYYVEVYDQYGNVSVSDTVTGQPLNNDPYPPTAKAGFDMNTMVGVETVFNGDMSTDNVGIVSYLWDFGDGDTDEGVRAVHVFREAGTYTVTLTVTDAAGNQDSDSIQVRALSPSQAGTVIIKVVDQDTGEALSDASVYIDYPGEPLLLRADSSGEVSIVAEPGTYSVSAYKIGYLPKEQSIKVEQYAATRHTIGIPQGEIVIGEIWTKRLTLDEIGALGIDTSDPDNRHVYNFEVTLVFEETEFTHNYTIDSNGRFYWGSTGGGGGGWYNGGGKINLGGGGSAYGYAVPSPTPESPPSLVYLTLSDSVSFLKEFYSVSLIMQNMADPQFVLTDNNFELNLPKGLSLAKMLEEQEFLQTAEEIPGGSSTTATWIVRGDEIGSYKISVNYNGILMPFNELVEAVFETDEDLLIEGGEGLKIYVWPQEYGYPGGEYYVMYALRNEGTIPYYDVKVTFGDNLTPEEYTYTLVDENGEEQEYTVTNGMEYSLDTVVLQDGLPVVTNYDTILVRTLEPGETLFGGYVTRFPEDVEGYYYQLIDAFSKTLEGSDVEIPVEFVDGIPATIGSLWKMGIWSTASTSGINNMGFFELEEEVLSVTGVNTIPFKLRHYSGYDQSLYNDIFNDHPDEEVWDFPSTGWSSNYEMRVAPQADGAINLYYLPGVPLRFIHTNRQDRVIYGSMQNGSVQIEASELDGDYYCSSIGYQDYSIRRNSDGTFMLTDADKNKFYFDTKGELLHTENRLGQVIRVSRDIGESGRTLTISEDGSNQRITAYYDSSGNLASVKDNLGREARLDYAAADEGHSIASLTTPAGDVVSYEYDGSKIIKRSINGAKVMEQAYDDKGRVVSQADGEGNTTAFSYDTESIFWQSIVTTTDRDGRRSERISNRLGHAAADTNGLGQTTYYTYNSNGDRTSVRDANGNTTIFDYDDKGNLLSVEDAEGVKESRTYDDQGNMLTHTSRTGAVTTYTYSDKNWLLQVVDERGVITEYDYNEYGQVLSKTVSDIGTSYYTYENGRPISHIDFTGKEAVNQYDAAGRRVSATDREGNTTVYAYDAMGHIVKAVDPEGNETSLAYNDKGNLISVIDPRGNETRYEYDQSGYLVRETNALNETAVYEYDGEGNAIKITAPDESTVCYTYDNAGRNISVTDPEGFVTRYEYDPAGQLTKVIYPDGGEQQFEYDRSGRIVREVDPEGGVAVYQYDASGYLALATDPMGNSYRFTYDLSGNRLSGTDGEGNTVSFEYDQYSRLISSKDANGNVTIYEYDEESRLVRVKDAMGDITQYIYDGNGRRIKMIDPRGAEALTAYDSNGNPTAVTNALSHTKTVEYDEAGNITEIIYPDGKSVRYTYTLLGQMETVTDYENRTTSYEYDRNGRLVKTYYPNGAVEEISYDSAGRVTDSTTRKGAEVITSSQYAYDGNGNITMEMDDTAMARIDYDKNGQLVEVTDTWYTGRRDTYMYTYDLGGNMTSEDITGRGSGAQSSWTDMSYVTGNQTDYWNGQEIEFDLDGNMIWGPLDGVLISYEYNELNQLIRAGRTSYGYDGEGRRIWQRDDSGSELRYITDPNASLSQLLVMQNSDGSSTYYVYGNGLISQEHFTPDGEAEYRIFHYDYRGSTAAMTDLDGRVTDRVTYDPYGRITSREGSTETIFLYVGQWGVQTDNNGLLYMRARYYSTDLNRFINEDPVKDGLNWYTYANNNPIMTTDAEGLAGSKGFRKEPNRPAGEITRGLFAAAQEMDKVFKRNEPLSERTLDHKGVTFMKTLELGSATPVDERFIVMENDVPIGIKVHDVRDGGLTYGWGVYVKNGTETPEDITSRLTVGKDEHGNEYLYMTFQDADDLFAERSQDYIDSVNRRIQSRGLGVTQDEFNALVAMEYNSGNYPIMILNEMEKGELDQDKIKQMFYNHIEVLIKENKDNEIFRDGWRNRADATLSVFFDATYIDLDKNPIEFDIIKNYEK